MRDAIDSGQRKPGKIFVGMDINARVEGFDSAKSPTYAHHCIMRNYSSVLLLGPPPGETFLELITHMFSEDEADVVRHLRPLMPLTARKIADLSGRSTEDVESTLRNLADNKHVILSFGKIRKYTILPLIPGTFEMAMIAPDLARNNRWHKRFSELFEQVWNTGYMKDYIVPISPPVRYLPSRLSTSRLQIAQPSDKLDEILDSYDVFAIAHCQCRVVADLAGRGCGKPTENCVAMGPIASVLTNRGYMRRADRKEVIEAKRIAEENGCITWMMNGLDTSEGNYSCSCCGCCCHALRTITQFNMPGIISPPRFIPSRNDATCASCGVCEKTCPMGAWKWDGVTISYDRRRCIGCGLCVTSCVNKALELVPVPVVKKPERNFTSLMLKMMPVYAAHTFRLWLRRATGIK